MSDEWEAPTPAQVATLLATFDGPWWIAGVVALDLFRNEPPRAIAPMQVAVLDDHWPTAAAALDGWDLRSAHRRVMGRPGADRPWAVEFLLADRTGGDWVHPDHPEVTLPLTDLGLATSEGIPYLRPEVVLLWMAADAGGHEDDLAAALPALGVGPRCWLAGALDLAHPGHPWITRVL